MSTKINNVLYLIGGTCTGKTTLARKLDERGFKWVRSVTTRPKRKGETDEYTEWIGEAEFNLRNAAGEFDYVREYYTHGASWFYGFRLTVCYNDFESDLPRLLDYIERKVPRP